MPYKSDQQRKWAHTDAGKKALGGEAAVHEWDESSKGKKLPKYAKRERFTDNFYKTELQKFGGMGQMSLSERQPKHPTLQKFKAFLDAAKLKKCGP
jgi:hypothetical protein